MDDFEIVTMEEAPSPAPIPNGRPYEEVVNDNTPAKTFMINGIHYYIKNLVDRMPGNLSFTEAGSLPLVALTAYQSLVHHAGLQAGQSVLINGCSGGVGTTPLVHLIRWRVLVQRTHGLLLLRARLRLRTQPHPVQDTSLRIDAGGF